MAPVVEPFFDSTTSTFSYVIHSGIGSQCAVIDSVLGYKANSGKTNTDVVDKILVFIEQMKLNVDWILETHIHADHLSAATYIRSKVGGRIAVSQQVTQVIHSFSKLFNVSESDDELVANFDYLFDQDEEFTIGSIQCKALYSPGHTPADIAYVVAEKMIFVGDTLFMPDVGTARCDFPGGSAETLYASIRRILAYPEDTQLMMCHDYPPATRTHQSVTTVAEQRKHNIHINDKVDETAFISARNSRDKTLDSPQLLFPSVQVNIRAGEFPKAESNGLQYLKIPLNFL
ncbi:MBL fold metallo-hydrolase [Neptuniibacter sp. 2_MG-2023]|uniref:MBL fold metallo-hydrolase n=1 Tax=Neptuniibacter sp. 2_MG-2023 TaxID=3062671 RepID=UPI0026E199BD|nr:MBL fold metallo-hydrolase [Neptuniibacter sp. 2_MG-2023]MDO6513630.1 MBL fold metallo-hydrolase [Neptuniibacter sp. 2_MG-2023]